MAEYDDGKVACTGTEILIRWYYFPAGTKRVPYDRIRQARVCPTGRGRIWGTGDFIHWRNLDVKRLHKDTGLVLEIGSWPTPVMTPDNPDEVIAALERHGVTVQR